MRNWGEAQLQMRQNADNLLYSNILGRTSQKNHPVATAGLLGMPLPQQLQLQSVPPPVPLLGHHLPASPSPWKLGPRAVLCFLFFSGCSALYLSSICHTQEDRLSSGSVPPQETMAITSFLPLLSFNSSLGYHQPHAGVKGRFQPLMF